MEKVKVGIVGATGYAGAELVRLLTAHPCAQIEWVGSRSYEGKDISSVYRNLFRCVDLECIDDDSDSLRERINGLAEDVDVIFTATPQGACASFISEELLNKCRVIDLSADFRLKDVNVYEEWYKIEHKAPQFIDEAVYGLVEVNRERIKKARLVANPGCYTTCSILTALPLVKAGYIDPDTLIVDALSGVSGAGRGLKTEDLFCEVNGSVKAYGVATHRHTPEIEEQLGYACGRKLTISFTPHLVPINRGILATEYAALLRRDGHFPSEAELRSVYENEYKNEKFIRLLPEGVLPETRYVLGSNFTDINIRTDERTGRVIMLGALDNLLKGAAGQAVQNMNVMFGLDESLGISMIPMVP